MSKRFYYNYDAYVDWTATAPFSDLWDYLGSLTGRTLQVTPLSPNTDLLSASTDSDVHSLPFKYGAISFVSPPLAAQTISGTVKGQMFGDQPYPGGAGFCYSVVIRVIRPAKEDPITHEWSEIIDVGTLLEGFPSTLTSEFAYAQSYEDGHIATQNRHFPPETALTPLAIQDGDCIVVELGFKRFSTGALDSEGFFANIYPCSEGNGDLPEDETTVMASADYSPYGVAQLDPWIEFSQDLAFAGESGPLSVIVVADGYIKVGNAGREMEAVVNEGGIAVGGPTQVVYGEQDHITVQIATGGVAVGGSSEAIFSTPNHLLVQADTGGIAVGGPASVVMGRPTHALLSASGSIAVGGPAKAILSAPPVARIVQALSGGIAVGGPITTLTGQPQGYLVAASQGGIQVGDRQNTTVTIGRPQTGAVEVLWGGIEVGGQAEISRSAPPASYLVLSQAPGEDSGIKVGGATGPVTFVHPLILQVIASGGIMVGGEPDLPPDEVYDTYALNGNAYEPSIFSGWNFNSYAMYRGKAYGAGSDGLYLLEGSDDDGAEIHTGVRVGPINFGTGRDKRLRSLRLGVCGGKVEVKVSNEKGQEGWFDVEDEGRVPVSSDLQGKNFVIDIGDFEELSQAEIIPLILVGR